MPHADEELLAALALGDLDDVPAEVREHVSTCPACQRQVDGLRRLADTTRTLRDDALAVPPPEVWSGVTAIVRGDRPDLEPSASGETTAARTATVDRRARTGRRIPTGWAAAAAVVALLAGAAGGWLAGHRGSGSDDDVVATTTLATLTGHHDLGSAEVLWTPGRTTLEVRLSTAPGGAGLHEVWLLNDDGRRMVALGLLPSDDRGAFSVPQRLLDEGYRTVDVSLEPDDGNPAHSGVSVARGTLVDG